MREQSSSRSGLLQAEGNCKVDCDGIAPLGSAQLVGGGNLEIVLRLLQMLEVARVRVALPYHSWHHLDGVLHVRSVRQSQQVAGHLEAIGLGWRPIQGDKGPVDMRHGDPDHLARFARIHRLHRYAVVAPDAHAVPVQGPDLEEVVLPRPQTLNGHLRQRRQDVVHLVDIIAPILGCGVPEPVRLEWHRLRLWVLPLDGQRVVRGLPQRRGQQLGRHRWRHQQHGARVAVLAPANGVLRSDLKAILPLALQVPHLMAVHVIVDVDLTPAVLLLVLPSLWCPCHEDPVAPDAPAGR
mmetsp:Transcript_106892/g.297673  ORF Transcript_106892/g.297673 Transcript_106892/m.297673 type:complete len:295 (+) Transcript_106892:53-937(+)